MRPCRRDVGYWAWHVWVVNQQTQEGMVRAYFSSRTATPWSGDRTSASATFPEPETAPCTQWALSTYWMNEYWVSQDYMTLQLCTWAWRNSHFCKPTSLWASGAPKPGSIHSMNQTAQMDGFLLPLWSEWLFSVMGLWQSIAHRWRDGFQIEGLTYSTSLIQVPPTPTPSWNYSVPVKTFKSQNGL